MAIFRMKDNYPSLFEKSAASPIDLLIGAAGGAPLPGRWGVGQALLEIWSQDPPSLFEPLGALRLGLWATKNTLSTVGVVRAYRQSTDPTSTTRKEDPIREFVDAKGLVIPEGLKGLEHLIHIYSMCLPIHEDLLVGREKNQCIRRFQTQSGIDYYFTFTSLASASERGGWFSGEGPFVYPEYIDRFRVDLSVLMWASEGGADLQLSMIPDEFGQAQFSITNIGDPDDYVSTGASSSWTDIALLAKRCQAFQEKGLSRKIMFYGPPGTGKTTLARNLARDISGGGTLRVEASAVTHAGTDMVMKFVRLANPRVILFDDLDRFQSETERILHYMERASDTKAKDGTTWTSGVIVIGTANAIGELDPALLRPGRFDEIVEVVEPEKAHLVPIINHYMHKFGVYFMSAEELATPEYMLGLSPAEIREILACVGTVGVEHLDVELARVRRQRKLYEGNKVADFLSSKRDSGKKASGMEDPLGVKFTGRYG